MFLWLCFLFHFHPTWILLKLRSNSFYPWFWNLFLYCRIYACIRPTVCSTGCSTGCSTDRPFHTSSYWFLLWIHGFPTGVTMGDLTACPSGCPSMLVRTGSFHGHTGWRVSNRKSIGLSFPYIFTPMVTRLDAFPTACSLYTTLYVSHVCPLGFLSCSHVVLSFNWCLVNSPPHHFAGEIRHLSSSITIVFSRIFCILDIPIPGHC